MRRFEHTTKENRRIHQLHSRAIARSPTSEQEQSSQATSIEMINIGNIEHEHADTLVLLR